MVGCRKVRADRQKVGVYKVTASQYTAMSGCERGWDITSNHTYAHRALCASSLGHTKLCLGKGMSRKMYFFKIKDENTAGYTQR